MASNARPYNLDTPSDLLRLFADTRDILENRNRDHSARRYASLALDDLILRMNGQPAKPPVCPSCFGDRVVRKPTDHGEWDDMPCSACNPHDMFGRPIGVRAEESQGVE